jgi:hypothetical protein
MFVPSFQTCDEVSPKCPVSSTIYTYKPNKGGNLIFLFIFAVTALAQVGLGWRHRKTWKAYSILVFLGSLLEALGYVGRVQLSSNVWNQGAFIQQITLLVVAPSFLAASLYLSMKALVIYLGPEHTRLPARWWTWAFVGADMFGFVLQLAGGGISSTAGDDADLADVGNNVTIVGISFQAATMIVAAGLFGSFLRNLIRSDGRVAITRLPKGIKLFIGAGAVAFFTILVRCIYR